MSSVKGCACLHCLLLSLAFVRSAQFAIQSEFKKSIKAIHFRDFICTTVLSAANILSHILAETCCLTAEAYICAPLSLLHFMLATRSLHPSPAYMPTDGIYACMCMSLGTEYSVRICRAISVSCMVLKCFQLLHPLLLQPSLQVTSQIFIGFLTLCSTNCSSICM